MAGVWAIGPGASSLVVSEPSALIGVFSVYAFQGGAGEQCVHWPAMCPWLGMGGSTVFFCRDLGVDIGASCLPFLAFVHIGM